jgi:pilus assembly protein CpaB
MRNVRAIVMLLLSVVIGLGAAVMAASWIREKGDASNQVVVAAVDIELGSRLNPQMLKAVAWPSGSVPAGAISDIQGLTDRVVKTSVSRGEALLEAKLAPAGTKGGLSAVIKEGNRAMTVRVNDVIGVAGFALPGNYVDVVVSTQRDNVAGDGKQISKIVLEHILVLAVAQEAGRDETKPKVVSAVTLEVTPSQAERLDLARSVGSLSLVLRNQVDSKAVDTEGITKRQLLLDEAVPVKVSEPAKPKPVRARRPAAQPAVRAVQAEPQAAPVAVESPSRFCVEVIKGKAKNTECF